jgi:hypothetical protein
MAACVVLRKDFLPMRDESALGEHPNDEEKYRSKSAGQCPSMLHEGQER